MCLKVCVLHLLEIRLSEIKTPVYCGHETCWNFSSMTELISSAQFKFLDLWIQLSASRNLIQMIRIPNLIECWCHFLEHMHHHFNLHSSIAKYIPSLEKKKLMWQFFLLTFNFLVHVP